MRMLCANNFLWTTLYDTQWSTRQPALIVPDKANFKQRATLRYAPAPIEKLKEYSYPDETYTFVLTVTCGNLTLFHGEHTLALRDDSTKLPSLAITNTIEEANQSLPGDIEDLVLEGKLVLIRDSDQAMALVWSLPPQSMILYDDDADFVFGEPDSHRGFCSSDVGYAARERDLAIIEYHNIGCDQCFEDRYLLLVAQLVPLDSNDIARGFAASTIDLSVHVDGPESIGRENMTTMHEFVSCLAVSAMMWQIPRSMMTRQQAPLVSSYAPAPIEKLTECSYPNETYTFVLTVTCGNQTLFHGEHTLALRDDSTKLPSLAITNTIEEANQSLPGDIEDLVLEGKLVLIRDSDQAMALVWSLPPQSMILYDDDADFVFGEPDSHRGFCSSDVGYAARERDLAIIEYHNIGCDQCFEDRYLLLVAQLVPLDSNDIARGFAASTIEPTVHVETCDDEDRNFLATSHEFIGCLAVSALKWQPLQKDTLDSW